MRCQSCNHILTDYEATRKTLDGKFLDFCDPCYEPIKNEVFTIDRPDLLSTEDADD